MTTRHTSEPWPEFNDRADGLEYGKNNERIYSVSLYEHDYNRARACVNACAGIDTAFLIAWAHGVQQNDGKPWADRIDETLSEIHAIKKQRDELLAALDPFAKCCADHIGGTEDDEEWAKFRLLIKHYRAAEAALAKAKGQ